MKRDLYEVSARIVAELEVGAAPWVKFCSRVIIDPQKFIQLCVKS
jgi:antirestriction protein ArdC